MHQMPSLGICRHHHPSAREKTLHQLGSCGRHTSTSTGAPSLPRCSQAGPAACRPRRRRSITCGQRQPLQRGGTPSEACSSGAAWAPRKPLSEPVGLRVFALCLCPRPKKPRCFYGVICLPVADCSCGVPERRPPHRLWACFGREGNAHSSGSLRLNGIKGTDRGGCSGPRQMCAKLKCQQLCEQRDNRICCFSLPSPGIPISAMVCPCSALREEIH
ncbi:uncharacterized protein LOC124417077 [Gallus gallus]|uniref:uncharacterized protein LOC124417077 n=1 Tax=Gallus gallus TaxID=9031 RepID=UPI001F0241EA|nr:uncharacterized protein LOC124417077 [Gallus gallus]